VAVGVTVGNRRIVRFKTVKTKRLKINLEAKVCPLISNIEVYRIPEMIESPLIFKDTPPFLDLID
jgi:alpha-L-fucosidase